MPARARLPAGIAAYALLAAAGGVLAYFSLFSQFAPHDDTGHLSVSLTEFMAGRNLYEDLYSQYGPLYFLTFGGLFSLPGVELTTDSVRILTLVLWVVCGLLLALSAERLTEDRRLGLLTGLVAYAVLVCLAPEPMHPIGITTLITCAIVAVAVWNRAADTHRVAIGIGLLVGAMAMIKVNIGALCAVGAISAALMALAPARYRMHARAGAALLLCGSTFVLLSTSLDDDWVKKWLVAQVAASLALVARSFRLGSPDDGTTPLRDWLIRFAAAGAGVVVVVCLAIMAFGTTPGGLIEGVIVDPTRHPNVDVLALELARRTVVLIGLALLVAVLTSIAPRNRLARLLETDVAPAVRAVARLLAALAIVYSIINRWPLGLAPEASHVGFALALAWLAAVAPAELAERTPVAFARLALVTITVSAVLGAYPVAGSQLGAAALPFCVVAALLVSDGLRLLAPLAARAALRGRGYAIATTAVIALLAAHVAVADVAEPARDARRAWKANVSLGLPGAKLTRIPAQQAIAYRQIVAAVHANHCQAVQTLPGNYSLNGWFEQRPPTGFNVSTWTLLVSKAKQREMIKAWEKIPRLCLLRIRNIDFDFTAISVPPALTRPGYRYLVQMPQRELLTVQNGMRLEYKLSIRTRR